MKKNCLPLVVCLLMGVFAKAQYVNIPDQNFQSFLISKYPACFNGLGQMDTTCSAVLNETSMDCSGLMISSLEGIVHFKGLQTLNCSDNYFWGFSVGALPNSIKSLNCSNDQLFDLDSLPSALTILQADSNQIEDLSSALPNNLIYLSAKSQNTYGQAFLAYSYKLPNSLKYLDLSNNNLDYTNKGSIYDLHPTFYLPDSIQTFICTNCNLKLLPGLPKTIKKLYCPNNNLTTLPLLPDSLTTLTCNNNNIEYLPFLPKSLTYFNCDSNSSITCLPNIPTAMDSLFIESTLIQCIPDTVAGLNINGNFTQIPVCNATNNPSGCNIGTGSGNFVNIPDIVFRNYLISKYPTCFNSLNQMDTTCSSILSATSLYLDTISTNGVIHDLTGLQYFKNLKAFHSLFNNLSSNLPIFPNSLDTIECSQNQITALPNLPTTLKSLGCSYNLIISLPNIPSTLTGLGCSDNPITNLPSLPDSLISLSCADCNLHSLPQLPNTLLVISCSNNSITELPKLPDSLRSLGAFQMRLSSLPKLPLHLDDLAVGEDRLDSLPTLPNSISYFDCQGNSIKSLPSLPNSLTYFYCNENLINTIPSLPNSLTFLNCEGNPLKELPKLDNNLQYLYCGGDSITYIPSLDSLNQLLTLSCGLNTNLTCLPKLPSSLQFLNVSNTGIHCLPNYNGNLNFANTSLPICNPTNNINKCNAYPTVLGRVFGDNNSNGIKDSDEFYIPYIPVNLNNGEIAFSNDSGSYGLSTKDTGSFTLTVTAPNNYKAVPTKFNFAFGKFDDVLTLNDIALQPTVIKDSLGIYIYPWQNAIPGRSMAYALEYRNYGTVNEDATISFSYDTSKLVFDTASVNLISHNGNTLVWKDTLGADYFGNNYYRNGFQYPVFYFKVKTKVAIGSGLLSSATIVSAKTSASITDSIAILDSYDPNSKEATPQLTTTQVADGDAIDYLIHFQNVGTATASAVVVADTLSNLLNPYVMQMIGISHDANVIIDNGIIYFQFLNINLPDSAANQLQSNGFVHFKLWPKSTVALGNTIKNNASIYFDYNNPVVTNTATTLIKNNPLPVNIISFQAHQVGDNLQIENDWTTANETNTAYYNVQRSTDGNNFSTIGRVVARGMGAGSYHFIDNAPVNGMNYYRLQSVDKDGEVSYSKVVSVQFTVNSNQLTVFPNPSKDKVTINGNHIASVQVIDNMGRVVKVVLLKDATNPVLSISGLANGVYHLRIQTTDGNVSGVGFVKE